MGEIYSRLLMGLFQSFLCCSNTFEYPAIRTFLAISDTGICPNEKRLQNSLTHLPYTKRPPVRTQHFQMHFHE